VPPQSIVSMIVQPLFCKYDFVLMAGYGVFLGR
jgi:hypothetical protein